MEGSDFPSDTAERLGRFVGFGESVGDALTFKILTDDTREVTRPPIHCHTISLKATHLYRINNQ